MWLDELADDAVDPRGNTPLHRQLSTVLRASITDGRLPAGSQLPTEAELQEKFGISRSVVRQALLTLTAEGLILRGRGRGSVVAPRGELHRLVQRMSGLSTQLPRVLEIRRPRSADGEPIALIETWLPLAESLTAAELTDAPAQGTAPPLRHRDRLRPPAVPSAPGHRLTDLGIDPERMPSAASREICQSVAGSAPGRRPLPRVFGQREGSGSSLAESAVEKAPVHLEVRRRMSVKCGHVTLPA